MTNETPLRAFQLRCGHWVSPPAIDLLPKLPSGWYAPMFCEHCGRRRQVVCLSVGGLREPIGLKLDEGPAAA
jgi:hypothetical protein